MTHRTRNRLTDSLGIVFMIVAMTVHVHLVKREQWRCPVCGRRCGVYDHASAESFWRGMDLGPVPVLR